VWKGKLARYPLKQGDRVRLVTGVGGGYGLPLERDLEMVREDIENGFISAEQAESMYAVRIDPPAGVIDHEETDRLRRIKQEKHTYA